MQQDKLASGPQLVVPPPSVARHPDTILRLGELKAWLHELPLADPRQLATQLHRQLRLLVRDPSSNGHYRDLLSAYHPMLRSLQRQVWDDMSHSEMVRKPALQLRNTVAQLLLEIACGHMRLVNQSIGVGEQPQASDLLHASLALARLLQWDVLQYNLTRPAIWRQLLQLFAISELYQLSASRVDSDLRLEFDARTVHSVFFSTLVLLLSDPYRLPRIAVNRLVTGLSRLAEHLRSLPTPQDTHCIALTPTGMAPPLRFARRREGETCEYLQLDQFLAQLEAQGLPEDDGVLAAWLRASLLDLADQQDSHEARRHQRLERFADYHFVHGLRLVHERLRDIQLGHHVEVDRQHTGIIVEEEFATDACELGAPARQTDHSLSGAGFRLHANVSVPEIGEWVLFEADAQPGQSSGVGFVGRIRRRLQQEDGSTDIGVEKLRGNIIPVGIGITHSPALLNADREQGVFQLIAPSGTFTQQAVQTLHGSNKQYRVQYDELLEQSDIQRIRLSLL